MADDGIRRSRVPTRQVPSIMVFPHPGGSGATWSLNAVFA
jgi:hypothetical protein